MSRSKNRKIADLISGGTFDDGVVAASEVTGLHSVASTGNFNELSNKPAPFDPATLASVAVSGSFNDLADQPAPFDPSTLATVATTGAYSALSGKPSLGTASTQSSGTFATAAQGTLAASAVQPNTNPTFGTVSASSLTGVGSIDATTASAIGAAGVGGAMKLLSDSTFGAVAGVYQSFIGNYPRYLIQLTNAQVWGSASFGLTLQLTDSSGTLLNTSYFAGNDVSRYENQASMFFQTSHAGSHSMIVSSDIVVTNPHSSSIPTHVSASVHQQSYESGYYYDDHTVAGGHRKITAAPYAEVNNSVYISNSGSGTNWGHGNIKIWGMS
jgi:hypothetical protein